MIEAFLAECPKCGAMQEWVRTEQDRRRLVERGETDPIGVKREVTVAPNRRLFVVRCSCGEVFFHRRVLGNEDELANARLNRDLGGAVNPLTGSPRVVVPKPVWKEVTFRDFIEEVRHFWGRKDKETLRQLLAREGVHIAPFKEVVVEEVSPPVEGEEAASEGESGEEPPSPAPSRHGKPPFPRPET
jgi:hypothetical protein